MLFLQSEANTTMATALAKLVLIVALFVVLQTCRARQGYALLFTGCALRSADLMHYINAASDVQGVLQEIERVAGLLDFHSKEL